MKELYTENFKLILKKVIKEDTKRLKNIGKINIIKMTSY